MEASGRLGAMPFIVTEYGRKMDHMGCPVSRRESNLRETRCSPAVASKALQFTMRFLKAKYNIVTIVTIAISPDKSYIVILTAFPQVANEASRTALNRLAARLGLDTQ